ncbi:TIGR02186 family protein [Bradyrhizobium sp. LHD-71]|uniref:TIGR02186 family protein n=1 Tax=Bradyrhizobium sp. LHD-71 TaxID=3072141 RepID=UPI00280F2E22|nr:TIGR02186 family protein [Bradyrhizobium sp. LHD-71]MDQ8730364.1 TIGR02186 family protein [Bradyrhizobium sp. LHD-71]
MKGLVAIAFMAFLLTGAPVMEARAERLIASVSNHRVTITPDYSGEELVLFGSIERDADTPPNRSYDLVVTVSGPRATMVTRRKEKRLGIWINADSREFINVPSYLAVFSNRPINTIASAELQRRQQLGLNNIILTQRVASGDFADVVPGDPFRAAFIRLRLQHGLYREASNAVTFLTPTLFRTGIPLPPEVPTGTYDIDIKLFADGALITRTQTAFEIVKVGFEQFVADAARRNGLLYGLATALMAMATGWLASVIFRKD